MSLLAILACAIAAFIWGRLRHDIVAVITLLAAVAAGIVPAGHAFDGFANAAVISVGAVLILSRGIQNSGAVDLVVKSIVTGSRSPTLRITSLGGVATALSSFINDVGALALLMPAAIKPRKADGVAPGAILMPLAFASILGGLITLIGTPPNIIIASYRQQTLGKSFGMFDYSWVGVPVAVAGLVFVAAIGWRLIPKERRKPRQTEELFAIDDYLTEARVRPNSKIVGITVIELEEMADKAGIEFVGLIRHGRWITGLGLVYQVLEGDILSLKASPEALTEALKAMDLELMGGITPIEEIKKAGARIVEAVIPPNAVIAGLSTETLRLRSRYSVNLLAVSRRGVPFRARLQSIRLEAGDVLLLQGTDDKLALAQASLGWLPLAERGVTVEQQRSALLAIAIFGLAISTLVAGWTSAPVAFAAGATLMVVTGLVSLDELYESVDWPVIVLLGALIPVGVALETTGATGLIAGSLAQISGLFSPAVTLTAVLVITIVLTNVMNNAATAVVMAPIAIAAAQQSHVHPDAFLMAVAIGASSAFLTPIGHQNNILVMGPGGYHFGDYWRMGLPLEIVIVGLSVPLLLYFWPL